MFHSLGYRNMAVRVKAFTQGPDLSLNTAHGNMCLTLTFQDSSEDPKQGGRAVERPYVSVVSNPQFSL